MWVNLAQLCFDVIELQALDKNQQEVFLRFYFYALNVKTVVFLQQINGFSWDYNIKRFFFGKSKIFVSMLHALEPSYSA